MQHGGRAIQESFANECHHKTLRPVDGALFCPSNPQKSRCQLLNADTAKLRDLQQRAHSDWNVTTDFVSTAATVRARVSQAYVHALLTTKIIVVAPRDEWEDLYRLFEVLAGELSS